MKVFKPGHIAYLQHVFPREGKNYLSLTMMRIFDFDDPQAPMSVKLLWEVAEKAFKLSSGELYDLGMPKTNGEYLVAGYCFPPDAPTSKSFVRVSFGNKTKTLVVYGDRVWQQKGSQSVASEPQSFSYMPLRYEFAFGGHDYPDNQLGVGLYKQTAAGERMKTFTQLPQMDMMQEVEFPQKKEEKKLSPPEFKDFLILPNVELPNELMLSPDDRPAPASFYSIPMINPKRKKLLGTYDEKWMKKNAPFYPDDCNWRYFNNAPMDQQFDEFLIGNESFRIENMNPEHPVIEGQLPDLKARGFALIQAGDGSQQLQEIEFNLDTAWLIPEFSKGVLVWHGVIPVSDHYVKEVLGVILDEEKRHEPEKPIAEYEKELREQLNKKPLAMRKLTHQQKEKDLVSRLIAKWTLPKSFTKEQAEKAAAEMNKQIAKQKKNVFKELEPLQKEMEKSIDNSLEGMKEALTSTHETMKESIEKAFAPQEALTQERIEKMANDYVAMLKEQDLLDIGDPDKKVDTKLLRKKMLSLAQKNYEKSVVQIKKLNPAQKIQSFEEAMKNNQGTSNSSNVAAATLERQLHKMQMTKAQYKIGPLSKEKKEKLQQIIDLQKQNKNISMITDKKITREQIEIAHARGESFAGEDFSFLDLSGIDLSGADLMKVNLKCTNLSNARLVNTDLTDCMLQETNLKNVNAQGASFFASIGTASDFSGADLSKADFTRVLLEDCDAAGANFTDADMRKSHCVNGDWHGCNFTRVKMHINTFSYVDMSDCRFQSSDIVLTTFYDGNMRDTVFENTNLKNTKFMQVKLQNSRFDDCQLLSTMFYDVTVTELVIKRCDATGMGLMKTNINSLIIEHTDLSKARFGTLNIDVCQLSHCKMESASFAIEIEIKYLTCIDCDLTKSSWIKADLPSTKFEDCTLIQACFMQAELSNALFVRCDATMINMNGANLQHTKIYDSNFKQAILLSAKLQYASLKNSNFYQTNFYKAYTKQTLMDDCLLQTPPPPNFEDQFIHEA